MADRVDLHPGVILANRYTLHAALGVSEHQADWRASDLRSHVGLLIRVVDARCVEPRERLAVFFSGHPAFPQLVDVGVLGDGRVWLAFELPVGIAPSRGFCALHGVDTVLAVFDQLLAATGTLHTWGIVHGSLRPNRILIHEREGRIRLQLPDLPWSSPSLPLLQAPRSRVTSTYGEEATDEDPYAAPEVRRGSAPTIASDLYSVAAVVVELLTSSAPSSTSFERIATSEHTPPDECLALLRAMMDRDPQTRPQSAWEARTRLRAALATLSDGDGHDVARLTPRLVARAEVMSKLRTVRNTTGVGPTWIRIVGPPGSGRSRILREALHDAALDGSQVVFLDATETLASLLVDLSDQLGDDARTRVVQSLVADLRFDAAVLELAEGIRSAAAKQPLWVAIDDLDRAGADAMSTLRALSLTFARTVWLATWPDEVLNLGTVCEVPLRALRRDEALSFVAGLLPGVIPADAARLVDVAMQAVACTPARLREGIVEAQAHRALAMQRGRWSLVQDPEPPIFNGTAPERALLGASGLVRTIVAALALAGHPLSIRELSIVVGVQDSEVHHAINDAVLLGAVMGSACMVRCADTRWATAAKTVIDEAQRVALSRALVLAPITRERGPALRAALYESLGEPIAAAREALSAAEVASSEGRLHDAVSLTSRARALGVDGAEVALLHGDRFRAIGAVSAALNAYSAAAARGASADVCATRKALCLLAAGRYEHADTVLRAAGATTDAGWMRAWCAMMLGRISEVASFLACVCSSEWGPSTPRLECLVALVEWHRNAREGALHRFTPDTAKVLEVGRSAGVSGEVGFALAIALTQLGDHEAAVIHLRASVEALKIDGDVALLARALKQLAFLEHRLGRWTEAEAAWLVCVDLAHRRDDVREALMAVSHLAAMEHDRGREFEARALLDYAVQESIRHELPRLEALIRSQRAEVETDARDLVRAASELDAAEALALQSGETDVLRACRRHRALLAFAHGDAPAALREIDVLIEASSVACDRLTTARLRLIKSRILRQVGRYGDAVAELEGAASPCDELGHRVDRARFDLEAAALASARGDYGRAQVLATQALHTFHGLGIESATQEAAAILDAGDRDDLSARLAALLCNASSVDHVLRGATDMLADTLGAECAAAIVFTGPEGPRVVAERNDRRAIRLNERVMGRLMTSRRPLAFRGGRTGLNAREAIATRDVSTLFATSLRVDEECLGALLVEVVCGSDDGARVAYRALETAAMIVPPVLRAAIEVERERERTAIALGTARWLLDALTASSATLELVVEEADISHRMLLARSNQDRSEQWVERASQTITRIADGSSRDTARDDRVELCALLASIVRDLGSDNHIVLEAHPIPVHVRADHDALAWVLAEVLHVAVGRALHAGGDASPVLRVEIARNARPALTPLLGWSPPFVTAPQTLSDAQRTWATVVIDVEGVQSVERRIDVRGGGASSVRLAAARLVLSRCGGLVRLVARPEGVRILIDLPEGAATKGEDPLQ